MGGDDLAWAVEEACLAAWPSPREILFDGWLLRCAGGSSRRINSLNPTRGGGRDIAAVLPAAEAVYAANGRPSLVRVPSLLPKIEAPLQSLGYVAEGETCTLFAEFDGAAAAMPDGVTVEARPGDGWIEAWAMFGDHAGAEAVAAYRRSLDAILLPMAFVRRRVGDETVAMAFGVVHRGLLVLESVATHPAHRGHGHGRVVVQAIKVWAAAQGARAACLQVVADNHPAQRLYRSTGFDRDLYRYHYRRKAVRAAADPAVGVV